MINVFCLSWDNGWQASPVDHNEWVQFSMSAFWQRERERERRERERERDCLILSQFTQAETQTNAQRVTFSDVCRVGEATVAPLNYYLFPSVF